MFLRSLALSKKLFAAVLLPVALVIVFLGVRITDALDVRASANVQEDEVARFVAVNAFADATNLEQVAYSDQAATDEYWVEVRAATDAAFENLFDASLGMPADVLDVMTDIHDRQVVGREILGAVPSVNREVGRRELAELGGPGPTITELRNFQFYPPEIRSGFEFDEDSIGDAEQASLLTSYALAKTAAASFETDSASMVGVAALEAEFITSFVPKSNAASFARTDRTIENVIDVAAPSVVRRVEALLASDGWAQFMEIRARYEAQEVGEAVDADPVVVASLAAPLHDELAAIADDTLAQIQEKSADQLAAANRRVVESAAIGLIVLLVVTLVLIALYRAIRNPLRRLTDRSTEIAEVELPGVVRVMRTGEGELPQITEITAESKDEIGDLTEAFNGMYRTAVELAAEQAASRRVVADMFVNLGRRNQKLLNRMLKGLGQLEQDEQDPDTLGALYKVDQLATRMRRNAESLLILAGASQSRTFRRDVPIYDVVQSALSEVEDFERVEIDVDSDLKMKGEHVADVAHMLAELVENALVFSPPSSTVQVLSRETPRGFIVAVADHGVGMTDEGLVESNRRIQSAADQSETPSEFLGHYVVGRLAARHGLTVELLEGGAGGTVARVLLPPSMFASDGDAAITETAEPAVEMATAQVVPIGEVSATPEPASAESVSPVAEAGAVVVSEPAYPESVSPVAEAGAVVVSEPAYPESEPEPASAVPSADSLDTFTVGTGLADAADAADLSSSDGEGADPLDGELEWATASEREVIRDFGSPAGESTPLPRADARLPLAEPSIGSSATDSAPIHHPMLEREVHQEPAPATSAGAVVPTEPATSTAFGFARREPGASLPVRQRRTPAATSTGSSESADSNAPDDVRASLAGFQTGVVRAEKETD